MGGDNEKTNLVLLTAREHFIAHKLLCEIYPDNNKLFFAYRMMAIMISSEKNIRNYNISSREYDIIKCKTSELVSLQFKGKISHRKGKTITDDHKQKISIANKGKLLGKPRSEIVRQNLQKKNSGIGNPFYGKTHSDETKKKLSEYAKNRTHSAETKRKMSDSAKGQVQQLKCCPYCLKIGGNTMLRWHFENCKYKNLGN